MVHRRLLHDDLFGVTGFFISRFPVCRQPQPILILHRLQSPLMKRRL
jgi:hypothetical protein